MTKSRYKTIINIKLRALIEFIRDLINRIDTNDNTDKFWWPIKFNYIGCEAITYQWYCKIVIQYGELIEIRHVSSWMPVNRTKV